MKFSEAMAFGVAARVTVALLRGGFRVDAFAMSMPTSERMHEALYLLRHGVPVEDACVRARDPCPLLLPLSLPLYAIWNTVLGRAVQCAVVLAVEVGVALLLRHVLLDCRDTRQVARALEPISSPSLTDGRSARGAFPGTARQQPIFVAYPAAVALVYFLNPMTVLSTARDVRQPLGQLLALGAICSAKHGRLIESSCAVATAMMMEIHYITLLLPVYGFLCARTGTSLRGALSLAVCFCVAAATFTYAVCALVGVSPSAALLAHELHSERNLAPNAGLWWYLFVLLYDRFWDYFLLVQKAFPLLHIAPIAIRLWHHPLLMANALMAVGTLSSPTVTASDAAFVLALALTSPHPSSLIAQGHVAVLTLVAVVCTMPMMWHLWLQAGIANSNYFYFQALVCSAILHVAAMTLVSSSVSIGRSAGGYNYSSRVE